MPHAFVEAKDTRANPGQEVRPGGGPCNNAEGAEQTIHTETTGQCGNEVCGRKAAYDLQQHPALLAARRHSWPCDIHAMNQGKQHDGCHGIAEEVQELRQEEQHTKAHAVARIH
eukprot:CAMPEP_0172727126 /NCGR_PEP_ID=MMETSP1074-20121228/91502_1 /TAXON_ID=2916 /ORGANISM="Ceratium fusus, Strain PA161109" /LENGTH=113 /DNA_ID=CAMNT_0013554243 /DNA_START=294 /DNA_END=635 /DNA_ORIENTATION=-